jgi:HSP20 family protein
MYPFDDDWKKRKRKHPFDFFGMDDEFEKMFREMERMMERVFRGFSLDSIEPGKSYVHGFNIRIGPDGKPKIEEFGNHPLKSPEGEPVISDDREPLTDVIECEDEIAVTVEIPGVEKEDIDLNVTETTLEIRVDAPQRKYHKVVDLPSDVIPKTTKATYRNGILDIAIRRKEKRKKSDGFRVDIK